MCFNELAIQHLREQGGVRGAGSEMLLSEQGAGSEMPLSEQGAGSEMLLREQGAGSRPRGQACAFTRTATGLERNFDSVA